MKAGSGARQDRGFVQLAATIAVLLSMGALLGVAFKLNDTNHNAIPAAAVSTANTENLTLIVKSDEEHAKKGADGNWHDAYLPADFSVQAGATVTVTVYNYDESPHTFTSTSLGTNVEIAAGAPGKPSKTTFTFHAPSKAGSYEWLCAMPCDPWAMNHDGFMRGVVTVV